MKISMIVACDSNWNIGKNGYLPWKHIKEDMAMFKEKTCAGINPAVLMGKQTWLGIPEYHRPLKNRINYVLSTTMQPSDVENAIVVNSISSAIDLAEEMNVEHLWIIGGTSVYCEFMGHVENIYITKIDSVFDGCDTQFPNKELFDFYMMESEMAFTNDMYNFKFQKWVIN